MLLPTYLDLKLMVKHLQNCQPKTEDSWYLDFFAKT